MAVGSSALMVHNRKIKPIFRNAIFKFYIVHLYLKAGNMFYCSPGK